MRTILVALIASAFLSCGTQPPNKSAVEPVAGSGSSHTKPPQTSTVMLTKDLEHCEAQLEQLGVAAGSDTPEHVKMKTRVVAVEGDPRRCASRGPDIAPVATTDCMPGYVCLDDKAQLTLAKNLAAYESWVTRVLSCENK